MDVLREQCHICINVVPSKTQPTRAWPRLTPVSCIVHYPTMSRSKTVFLFSMCEDLPGLPHRKLYHTYCRAFRKHQSDIFRIRNITRIELIKHGLIRVSPLQIFFICPSHQFQYFPSFSFSPFTFPSSLSFFFNFSSSCHSKALTRQNYKPQKYIARYKLNRKSIPQGASTLDSSQHTRNNTPHRHTITQQQYITQAYCSRYSSNILIINIS